MSTVRCPKKQCNHNEDGICIKQIVNIKECNETFKTENVNDSKDLLLG